MAQLRSVCSGEVLDEPSCPDVPLFIVLDGTVSISRTGQDEKVLAIRESGQFTGEMSLISGNRPLLTARVTQDGAVLELTREKVLSLMAKDIEVVKNRISDKDQFVINAKPPSVLRFMGFAKD